MRRAAIPGFPGYEISEDGIVFGLRKGEPLALFPIPKGYIYARIKDANGVYKSRRVHRLVWAAFVGPISDGVQINHKDFNKANNALSNLEAISGEENIQHAIAGGKCEEPVPIELENVATGERVRLRSRRAATKWLGVNALNISGLISGRFKTQKGWRLVNSGKAKP